MLFGIALITCWVWFLANYQVLNIHEIKDVLLWFGIGVILMVMELVWEVKSGFKLVFKFLGKVIVLPIKSIHHKRSLNKIQQKIRNGTPLTKREVQRLKSSGDRK